MYCGILRQLANWLSYEKKTTSLQFVCNQGNRLLQILLLFHVLLPLQWLSSKRLGASRYRGGGTEIRCGGLALEAADYLRVKRFNRMSVTSVAFLLCA